jgi:hypothetical protein
VQFSVQMGGQGATAGQLGGDGAGGGRGQPFGLVQGGQLGEFGLRAGGKLAFLLPLLTSRLWSLNTAPALGLAT